MRLPSKITSYGESVISKFPPVLSVLQDADTGVLALYTPYKTNYLIMHLIVHISSFPFSL